MRLDVALASEVSESAGVATLRTADDVLVVALNRPERLNALDLGAWQALGALFAGEARDATAVVVRGAGTAFSAGADIDEFPARRMTARDALAYNRAIAAALEAVIACPAPVVAMIGGAAVGGGCELAAACDVRVASEAARFGIPIGRLGVTLGPVEARAIARLIGPARLKELVFSGRLVDAGEAREIGLVERVVAADRLVAETVALIDAIRGSAPTTIRATKRVAELAGRSLTPADADLLAELLFSVYEGEELREGVAAFGERREPRFDARQVRR